MLKNCETANYPESTQVDYEEGKVVYGDVEFGANYYRVSFSEEEELGDSDYRDYSEEPKFDATKPFVMLITNKRTTYKSTGDKVEYTHYVIIYTPKA